MPRIVSHADTFFVHDPLARPEAGQNMSGDSWMLGELPFVASPDLGVTGHQHTAVSVTDHRVRRVAGHEPVNVVSVVCLDLCLDRIV